jgi:hypothetical protein
LNFQFFQPFYGFVTQIRAVAGDNCHCQVFGQIVAG